MKPSHPFTRLPCLRELQASSEDGRERLQTPPMTDRDPGPGRRVRQVAEEYAGTDVHHSLYLPVDWKPGGRYPVIVEYTGNDFPPCGSTGEVGGANLGYGLTGGRSAIWVVMPCVEKGGLRNAVTWWGDRDATVEYCKANLPRICAAFGGDLDRVVLCGFSRGAIGISYIGLADDAIASLWRAFFTHDHFDGERRWPYPSSDRESALVRLKRLAGRPVFVSGLGATRIRDEFLGSHLSLARFSFLDVPVAEIFDIPEGKVIHPHTDLWMSKDSRWRRRARAWLACVLGNGAARALSVVVSSPDDPGTRHLSWPKVVTAPDGTVVLVCSAGVGHNRGGSGPAVSVSGDGGRSFAPPKLLRYFPDDDSRYRDCGNLALGVAPDGAVVVLAMAFRDNTHNTVLGWRSADSGETWVPADTSCLAENRTGSVFGSVMQVPGVGLAVFGHYREPGPPGAGIWFSTSSDQGRSWRAPRTVTATPALEPAAAFADGRFVVLLRGLSGDTRSYGMAVSDDLGETWRVSDSGIVIPEGFPGIQPSPFIGVSPTEPTLLYALQSIRGEAEGTRGRICLWTADIATLDWENRGELVGIPLEAGDLADWAYPWMTPIQNGEWLLVLYGGVPDGACSLYGMTFFPDWLPAVSRQGE